MNSERAHSAEDNMSEGAKSMGKGMTAFVVTGVSIAAVGGAILIVGAVKAFMAKRAAAKKAG